MEIDFTKFITDSEIESVKTAFEQLKKPVTLKPIFEFLNSELSYDKIKIALSLIQ